MAEEELVIRGPFLHDDMEDLLKIARVEGRKKLKCDNIRVKPFIEIRSNNKYVVKISPK